MSLKPAKKSDQKKQEELRVKMQKRKQKDTPSFPPCTYIATEGTKTEPNYLRGLVRQINQKYKPYTSRNMIILEGVARNTTGLLEYAQRQVERRHSGIEQVWLVYDKDDFPVDHFDNTQFQAEATKQTPRYKVAWSNESIELWFLLHFQDYTSDNGREQYISLLKQYLPNYTKNDDTIFEQLKPYTQDAIRRAKAQYQSYGDIAPSKRVPATRVFQLVEELQAYL